MKTIYESKTGKWSIWLLEDLHLYICDNIDSALALLHMGKFSKANTIRNKFEPIYDDVMKSDIISLDMWNSINQWFKTQRYEKVSHN